MKNRMLRILSFAFAAVMLLSLMTACSDKTLEEFEGDVRYRYDYNLYDYIKPGDYKGLSVNIGSEDPTKREIEARILEYRVLYTATVKEWNSVGEGVPAKKGDIVDVRYQGYLDGEKLSDVAHSPYKEEGYSMTLGSDLVIEGMDEKLIGMKIGEKKTIEVKVPDPCFKYPYYVGKTLKIDVEITNIRAAELEPYDEAFANYYGADTIDGFESNVVMELKRNRSNEIRDYVLDRAMREVLDNFETVKYPEKELDYVIESLKESDKEAAKDKEYDSVDEYITKELGVSVDEYNKELEEYAKDVVHMEMTLYFIARKEQIALTNAAFDEKATILAQENGMTTPSEYVSYMAASGWSEEAVRENIWFELVYDFMYENITQTTEK
ncbi:MAG: hypothetical protein E7578_09240 [Ruminococcaceae bacterium]|nr:hypothetical protein [Oscillospiraceae bacterium]